jgi:hypothetical protein
MLQRIFIRVITDPRMQWPFAWPQGWRRRPDRPAHCRDASRRLAPMDAPFKVLHDLRNPPFVADPEFTPFDVGTLVCDSKSAPASPSDPTQVSQSKHRRLYTFRREFPIPQLVGGLPWRFAQHVNHPVVSEAEFAPWICRISAGNRSA